MKKNILLSFGCWMMLIPSVVYANEKTHPLTQKINPPYNPSTEARIRLYGQNGKKIYFQHRYECETQSKPMREYLSREEGTWTALKAMARINLNYSIGMPRTPLQKQVEGSLNTYQMVSYHEYVVAAKQPVSLYGFIIDSTPQQDSTHSAQLIQSCDHAQGFFIPQPGHSYEISGEKRNDQCIFKVYDLDENQFVQMTQHAYQCPSKPRWKFWEKDE